MNNLRLVYLNGQFQPPDAAQVSVFDRGFIFGDGVYEVIPVYGGRPFRLPHHLARLDASLGAIRLQNPLTAAQWQSVFDRLIRDNDAGPTGDQSIYLQVTRGVAPRDHAFPPETVPTVFVYAQPLTYPSSETRSTGISAITTQDIRWIRCDIKATALLANALLRQQAIDQGAAEAILLRDGLVTEGAASNIFVVVRGRVITPPKGPHILPGVTRDLVLELAHAHGIPCGEEPIREDDLFSADEVWMTSSTKEILPVIRINAHSVGTGKPGPQYARLFALYQEYKDAFARGQVA